MFVILGNHDLHEQPELTRLIAERGPTVLQNDSRVIRRGNAELVVAGIACGANGRVDASPGGQHREVVRAAPSGGELLPPLARVAEVGVWIDEAGHDDATLDVDVDRAVDPLDHLVRAAVTGRDDRAVARRDEPIHHRADIARRGADAGTLLLQRLQRQQSRAVKDEVRRRHSRKWLSMTRSRVKPSSFSESAATCSTAARCCECCVVRIERKTLIAENAANVIRIAATVKRPRESNGANL